MIPLEEKIAKTQRLLRRLEEDQPYLHARLSALGAEHRQSANAFADWVRTEAEAELQRLLAERPLPYGAEFAPAGGLKGLRFQVSGKSELNAQASGRRQWRRCGFFFKRSFFPIGRVAKDARHQRRMHGVTGAICDD